MRKQQKESPQLDGKENEFKKITIVYLITEYGFFVSMNCLKFVFSVNPK
jgi:hypothetical protein